MRIFSQIEKTATLEKSVEVKAKELKRINLEVETKKLSFVREKEQLAKDITQEKLAQEQEKECFLKEKFVLLDEVAGLKEQRKMLMIPVDILLDEAKEQLSALEKREVILSDHESHATHQLAEAAKQVRLARERHAVLDEREKAIKTQEKECARKSQQVKDELFDAEKLKNANAQQFNELSEQRLALIRHEDELETKIKLQYQWIDDQKELLEKEKRKISGEREKLSAARRVMNNKK